MLQYRITRDQKFAIAETERIGYSGPFSYNPFNSLSRNQEFSFVYTPTGFSLGDWGVLSRLPEYIKKIYPNCKFYYLSPDLNKKLFASEFQNGWWMEVVKDPWNIGKLLMQDNPFVDGFLEYEHLDESDEIFHDHYRIWGTKELLHEPVIEQNLRAFGATEEELRSWDTRPLLYFPKEVEERCEEVIKKYVGSSYGCLLTASRIPHLNRQWDFDNHLVELVEEYKNLPAFYYTAFDYERTCWADCFSEKIPFVDLKLSLVEQLYIKQRAELNVGYQAGITDAISGGGSEVITLTPYKITDYLGLGVNITRKSLYVFEDGTKVRF